MNICWFSLTLCDNKLNIFGFWISNQIKRAIFNISTYFFMFKASFIKFIMLQTIRVHQSVWFTDLQVLARRQPSLRRPGWDPRSRFLPQNTPTGRHSLWLRRVVDPREPHGWVFVCEEKKKIVLNLTNISFFLTSSLMLLVEHKEINNNRTDQVTNGNTYVIISCIICVFGVSKS